MFPWAKKTKSSSLYAGWSQIFRVIPKLQSFPNNWTKIILHRQTYVFISLSAKQLPVKYKTIFIISNLLISYLLIQYLCWIVKLIIISFVSLNCIYHDHYVWKSDYFFNYTLHFMWSRGILKIINKCLFYHNG